MPTEINYKGDLIVEFDKDDYEAFVYNADGNVENESFTSLIKAKNWIDNYGSTKRQNG